MLHTLSNPLRWATTVLVTVALTATLLVVTSARSPAVAFEDTAGSPFADDIRWAADRGITLGCDRAGTRFCPASDVTRAQMARFLVRALDLTEGSGVRFRDVPSGTDLARDVDRLATAGITFGCDPARFCPGDPVTRAHMAGFLARGLDLQATSGVRFRDVPSGHALATEIDRLATAGITYGCSSDRYCPARSITRGQMAALLHRGLAGAGDVGAASAGWRLAWSDEFSGSQPSSVWRRYHNTYGDGNRELQCYTPDNVAVSGGTLRISAREEAVRCPSGTARDREFTSGFLGTRETGTYFPRYGRFEIRARVPHAQGMWPAFWLRHRNGSATAEVDVMEYFHSQVPGKTTATLHLDGRLNLSKRTVAFEAPTVSPGWHVWGVEIVPVAEGVRFRFSLDGEVYHSYVDTQHGWVSKAPEDATWDLAVNLAVGGDWVGHPNGRLGHLDLLDRCSVWGATAPCPSTGIRRAQFPETYEVDWIRVWTPA